MRALLVTDSFPPGCGGSGWSVDALASGLASVGVEVEVIHRRVSSRAAREQGNEGGVTVSRLGVPELSIPVVRDGYRALWRDRALERFIVERAGDSRPDLIHAQQGSNLAAVARAARATGVASVATVRDYAPICLRTTRFREGQICPGCSAPRLARCFADRYGKAGWLLAPLTPLGLAATVVRTRALDRFARVIAVSGYVRDRLRESGVTAPIDVVPNLPPEPPREIPRPTRAAPGPYVLFAGKLNSEKGADWLPGVASALDHGCRLVVLGDGPRRADLERLAKNGSPIDCLGSVGNDEVLAWIAHARCLVLPSRWPEPLSRLLLEAASVGTPVVALPTGGTPELIVDEVTGLFASDAAGLAAAVRRVVMDVDLRARLSAGIGRLAETTLRRRAILDRMLEVYRAAWPAA